MLTVKLPGGTEYPVILPDASQLDRIAKFYEPTTRPEGVEEAGVEAQPEQIAKFYEANRFAELTPYYGSVGSVFEQFPVPENIPAPEPKIGQLYWPVFGAARYAHACFLMDGWSLAQLYGETDFIEDENGDGLDDESDIPIEEETGPNDVILTFYDDPTNGAETGRAFKMSLLAARPLIQTAARPGFGDDETVEDDAWVVIFVDKRYYWRDAEGVDEPTDWVPSSWTELMTTLSEALPGSPGLVYTDTPDGAYLNPTHRWRSGRMTGKSTAHLLDAAAAAVGGRIVYAPDDTLSFQRATATNRDVATTAHATHVAANRHSGGGLIDSGDCAQGMPSFAAVVFFDPNSVDDPRPVTYTANIGGGGVSQMVTACLDIPSVDSNGDPTVGLSAASQEWGDDFYQWNVVPLDTTYSGCVAVPKSAFIGHVTIFHDSKVAYTKFARPPVNYCSLWCSGFIDEPCDIPTYKVECRDGQLVRLKNDGECDENGEPIWEDDLELGVKCEDCQDIRKYVCQNGFLYEYRAIDCDEDGQPIWSFYTGLGIPCKPTSPPSPPTPTPGYPTIINPVTSICHSCGAKAGEIVAFSGCAGGGGNTLDGETCWIKADGRDVARATYTELNALYGDCDYPFGDGDGTTTFNVPSVPDLVSGVSYYVRAWSEEVSYNTTQTVIQAAGQTSVPACHTTDGNFCPCPEGDQSCCPDGFNAMTEGTVVGTYGLSCVECVTLVNLALEEGTNTYTGGGSSDCAGFGFSSHIAITMTLICVDGAFQVNGNIFLDGLGQEIPFDLALARNGDALEGTLVFLANGGCTNSIAISLFYPCVQPESDVVTCGTSEIEKELTAVFSATTPCMNTLVVPLVYGSYSNEMGPAAMWFGCQPTPCATPESACSHIAVSMWCDGVAEDGTTIMRISVNRTADCEHIVGLLQTAQLTFTTGPFDSEYSQPLEGTTFTLCTDAGHTSTFTLGITA